MTKHDVALVVPFLAVALVGPADARRAGGPPQPPVAAKSPHTTEIHGYTLKDDYFWLREKSNPEVIAYLEAENAYTEEVMQPTKALQETLYKEMLGRIKQTDLSVPSRIGELLLLLAHRGGQAVPVHVPPQGQHGRRRGGAARPQRAGRGPHLSRPRRLRGQRRRQLAGVFAGHDRLPAVHAAREGPARPGRRSTESDRAGRLGGLGDRQQDALLHDRRRRVEALGQGLAARRSARPAAS